jgi:hypothetical protein
MNLNLISFFSILLHCVWVLFMPRRSVTIYHAVVGLNNIIVMTIHSNCIVIKLHLICAENCL